MKKKKLLSSDELGDWLENVLTDLAQSNAKLRSEKLARHAALLAKSNRRELLSVLKAVDLLMRFELRAALMSRREVEIEMAVHSPQMLATLATVNSDTPTGRKKRVAKILRRKLSALSELALAIDNITSGRPKN